MALLTQSYVHGTSSTPLIGETIGQNLRRVTTEGPGRPALVTCHQNLRWSYADLLSRSEDLAVGLRKLGLEKGDRLGVWSANVSEWVLAQFGTALAGIVLVNINPAYRSHEFDYAIKKSGCRALILSPQEQRLFRLAPDLRPRDRHRRTGQTSVQRAAKT
jgi:fatty-acyl-CoA synthase